MSKAWRSDKHEIRTGAGKDMSDMELSMSNAELLAEVDRMMAEPAENMDTDKIEAYLALLQERAPVLEDYANSPWESLQASHPDLFVVEEEPAATTAKKGPRRVTATRAFRWVTGFVAAMLCLVLTANAFGFNPVQAFLNWVDGVVQIYQNPSGIMELPPDDPSEFHSIEEALENAGEDSSGCPKWVPRDYALSIVRVSEFDNVKQFSAIYNSERGELLIRVFAFEGESWGGVSEREQDGTTYLHNNVEYYLVSNYDLSKAGWNNGKNAYVISGQISESELKEMIDSIT